MIKGIVDFLERLPIFSFRSGLILTVVGLALQLGIKFGVISQSAINGYIEQAAPVLWIGGMSLMLSAALLSMAEWGAKKRSKISSQIRKRREKDEKVENLIGNISFLEDSAKLLLYILLQMPKGRMESNGSTAFERLWNLNLIQPEEIKFVAYSNAPAGIVRVRKEIYDAREETSELIKDYFMEKTGIDISVEENIEQLIEQYNSQGIL